jgi:hypothetical protein
MRRLARRHALLLRDRGTPAGSRRPPTSSTGSLEVKAWQDTTHGLDFVGSDEPATNTIGAIAATGIDSSHVVTADIDAKGVLSLRTWTLGGTAGIAPPNHFHSPVGTANSIGLTPSLGMADLSPTQVVTASENGSGNLIVQAWTVGDTSAAPVASGDPGNGGPVNEVSIAAIDSATVITAAVTAEHNLQVSTWGVDATGVHLQDRQVLKKVTGDDYPSVSIGAGTAAALVSSGGVTILKSTRLAFTPIVNEDNVIEVIDWQISPSGAISQLGKPTVGGSDDFALDVAACMLPTGVPMSVYGELGEPGDENYVKVGWIERGLESEFDAIDEFNAGVTTVAATAAGTNSPSGPTAQVYAYFVTGALTYTGGLPPSTSNPGTLKLQVWSYPIAPPFH